MSLTTAQSLAFETLKAEYATGDEFSTTFDPTSGHQVSKATMRALELKGLLKLIRVDTIPYTVRGQYGKGIRHTKYSVEAVYTFA
ncbi:hypothetical protein [Chroococcidiopsis sp.]|uniref:hypothetical protein n=1 Tax=Chroococcidiopsis sp. TaxID=3088168 RepID=UPI003F2DA253